MKTTLRDVLPDVVRITKIVHGGQGLGTLADGKKVFAWNALPGETVRVRIVKQRRSYVEAIAEEIIEPSVGRIEPIEENYLATSPWQIMTFEDENRYKKSIVKDLLEQAGISTPLLEDVIHDERIFHYRNKMEYSFWGDEEGLHLALYRRGTHGKQIVSGSKLAMSPLDVAANNICALLGKMHIRAGDLKTIVVRCNQAGQVVGGLYVKTEIFPHIALPQGLQGLRVYYSNPKSPASVPTTLLCTYGNCMLEDSLLDRPFIYDGDSFFQVNIPVFELALQYISTKCRTDDLVDMYAGVGSIGLSIATQSVDLVELDPASAAMARLNANASHIESQVIEASTEKALEYIVKDKPIVFDPPRAGLHDKVVAAVVNVRPPKIVYLSCNPATQARDLSKLQEIYKIDTMSVFNFFPRTPHIETLAVLSRKS